MVEQVIETMGLLEVVHSNMSELNETDQAMFAMLRRSGLGASDSSIVVGVNKWRKVDDLIKEKRSIGLTPEEIEVSKKESVRRGRDLEPLILEKFAKQHNVEVHKPSPMYRIKEHPHLTINFDGIIDMNGYLIPVEVKAVTTFGDKYWDKSKSIDTLWSGEPYQCYGRDPIEHIVESAKLYGIPDYYYTQIQQQMLGLHAEFGYFAVLFDKGWELKTFKVYRDPFTQQCIIDMGATVWNKIKEL